MRSGLLKLLILSCIVTCVASCDSYTSPGNLNLQRFNDARQELITKTDSAEILFPRINPKIDLLYIQMMDFQQKELIKKVFPKCYTMLNEKQITEIYYFPKNCIIFILKKHKGMLNDKYECLIKGDDKYSMSGITSSMVLKQQNLRGDWRYQIVQLDDSD